ncbi:protein tim21 [Aspergillus brunneoviolaceus CBS 621.78]|uniref:Import inner membrane translocase subunit tim21 mitochondrial n=1 Tax=Aspergillus brunneoviolaceus CBS 621.78 TaxID=1450534 RepID=A0ACD1GD12_9EURO|nr:putative import inner membrane translocase subunit tim21 mitochondrial precursor [Aspergillus brunneoviolaceus CBS 621.78]RAH47062.1 putative import inner membrane translocase subunit tim21 mitochondrial precursor [Aspergillus brunneoviolaceus CBS 621.78]
MLAHLRPNPALFRASSSSTAAHLLRRALPRTTALARYYATSGPGSNPTPKRRNVTVLSDDGRYEWGELSGREKVARATQQSVNFLVVVAGAVLTGGVFYLLYTEVFSPNSKTWQFEKAVERIKDDPRCTDLLGDRREIKVYGDSTWSRWARNRPIATSVFQDRMGREHLKMNFHVEGPLNTGIVFVHMMKPLDQYEWEYQLLALEVKGHPRVVLEQAREKPGVGKALKIFGIQWR